MDRTKRKLHLALPLFILLICALGLAVPRALFAMELDPAPDEQAQAAIEAPAGDALSDLGGEHVSADPGDAFIAEDEEPPLVFAAGPTTDITIEGEKFIAAARPMLDTINAFRADASGNWCWKSNNIDKTAGYARNPLTYDYNLELIALQRAYEIAIDWSHRRPNGDPFDTWARSFSINGKRTEGENLAWITIPEGGVDSGPDMARAFELWREEDKDYAGQGHRRNMLYDDFTAVGLACVKVGNTYCWVQEFGRTNSGAAQTPAQSGTETRTIPTLTANIKGMEAYGSPRSYNLYAGQTVDLPGINCYLVVTDEDGADRLCSVTPASNGWTSADASVVQASGTQMNALAKGEVTISNEVSAYGHTATAQATVKVRPTENLDLSNAEISFVGGHPMYTGEPVAPTLRIVLDGVELTEGDEYYRSFSQVDVTPNTWSAIVWAYGEQPYFNGIGRYYGVLPRPINQTTVEYEGSWDWTGSAVEPPVTITFNNMTLEQGKDFDISYANNVNAGNQTAKITLKGKGNYSGTVTKTFSIMKKDLANAEVEVGDLVFNGRVQKHTPVVSYNGAVLEEGMHYNLSFSPAEPVDAQDVTVQISGMGEFADMSTSATYKILPLDINSAENPRVDAAFSSDSVETYDGKAHEKQLAVTAAFESYNVDFTQGEDFTVAYSNNVNAGTARATLTGKGNLTGTRTLEFAIAPADIGQASIANIANEYFDGAEKKPVPELEFGGKTLVPGTDFDLSYSNNVQMGDATVTITGKGNFTGSTSASFAIVEAAKDLADAQVTLPQDTLVYTGTGQLIRPTVVYNGTTLTEGFDYLLISPDDPKALTNVGTVSVKVKGIRDYVGSVTYEYRIVPAQISEASISDMTIEDYNGSAHTPEPLLQFNYVRIEKDVDYVLSYANNVDAGTATLTVTGTGNFTGTVDKSFEISPARIGRASVEGIEQRTYTGSPFTPKPTVKLDGLTLKEGVDYQLRYSSNTNAGTAIVYAKGMGNFTDTAEGHFTIAPAQIFTASISAIPDQSYSGEALTPKPEVRFGGRVLEEDWDYTVAYERNTGIGTARAVISGTGNFTGSTAVEFKIVPAQKGWKRLAGKNALLTMREIVREGFTGKGGAVVLATSGTFKDALSAASLAGKHNAPILMTPTDTLSAVTKSELDRLRPAQVFIVGGELAVSEAVEDAVRRLPYVGTVERLAGANAADTSRMVAERIGSSDTVIVATSADFADALSIAPWSYAYKAPIILTSAKGQLAQASLSRIRKLGAKRAIIAGGTLAVTQASEDMLVAAGLEVVRLAGKSAVGTSEAIAKWELENGFSLANVACATRGSYKDALSGSALMGRLKGPIMLVNGTNYSAARSVLKGKTSQLVQGYFFGGEAAISAETAANIEAIK